MIIDIIPIIIRNAFTNVTIIVLQLINISEERKNMLGLIGKEKVLRLLRVYFKN